MNTNNIKFLHYRRYDVDNEFYDVLSARGGVTFAYQLSEDGTQVAVAKARCNDTDNFDKRIGREISSGRLKVGKDVQVFDYDGSDGLTFFVQNLIDDGSVSFQ